MPSSIKFYTQTIGDFKRLQTELYKKQGMVGAETKASTYKELGTDITTVENLSFAVDKANRYVTGSEEASRRIDSIFNAVGDILNNAQNFKKTLVLENSSSANVNDLFKAASAALQSLQGTLNTREGSLYIFGGSKTDQQPAKDMDGVNNYIQDTPTANYFQGDDYKFSVSVNSTLKVEYGVTASDEAFKKLAAAYNVAKQVESGGGQAELEKANNLLDEAIDQLIGMRATLGDNQLIIKQSAELQKRASTTLSQNLKDINSPDVVSLSIEISSLEASLQASFSNFTTISKLRLTDYV